MAQKRMFDRSIIDTDRFMDMQMSAKALYFLLGMEADDEGFVSYKKVMRIHGGNEDDMHVLAIKNFIIKFDSGVVVITDWCKNNWLDGRRIKPTEYQTEKQKIALNRSKEYTLSDCLAPAVLEERSVVESRGEENSDDLPEWLSRTAWSDWVQYRKESRKKITPSTERRQIKMLSQHIEDHVKIIEQSIEQGWMGLFPIKKAKDNKKNVYAA